MAAMLEDDEIGRALKLLEALIKAHGLTKKALDHRLQKGPGYISQVLTGRLELKYRHILEILGALDLEPGLFFRALFLEPQAPTESGRMMERFLEGLQKMGYYGERAAAPPAPPQPAGIDPAELDRRIRNAVHDALAEHGEDLSVLTHEGLGRPEEGGRRQGREAGEDTEHNRRH